MKPFITLKELKEKIEKKEVTPKEAVNFFAKRIKKHNPTLNSFVEFFDDILEKDFSQNKGDFAGIPVLFKDNICQKGRLTTAASKILSNYKATYNATIVERLNNQGAISMGRGNLDEFAMGSSGEFSIYGPAKNPWDETRTPGGSSSGPGSAVAAGLTPLAFGTETGGSVRLPASFCGIVGLYPTYGLLSRYGLIALTSSTDQPGPFTRTVYDNAMVLSSLIGQDPKDTTSLTVKKHDYTKELDGKLPPNLKIGIIKDAIDSEGLDPEIREAFSNAVKHLENLGAKVSIIDLQDLKHGIALYYIINPAEASSNLYRYDGTLYGNRDKSTNNLTEMYLNTRHDNLGDEVKRRILLGNYVLSAGHEEAYYKKAQKIRRMIRSEFENAFHEVDLLVSPTAPMLPFKFGTLLDDPVAMYLADFFTVSNCIIGTPAISLPCGFSKENLPIGFQFLGPRLSEQLLYKVAHAFQESTDYHLKTPENHG